METVLIFGASGQLGTALQRSTRPDDLEVTLAPRSVDLSHRSAVVELIEALRPAWIINAAAMTNVDGAHVDPGHFSRVLHRRGLKVRLGR